MGKGTKRGKMQLFTLFFWGVQTLDTSKKSRPVIVRLLQVTSGINCRYKILLVKLKQ